MIECKLSYSPSKPFSLAQRTPINAPQTHEVIAFSVNSVNTSQLQTIFGVCLQSTYHAFSV